MEESDNHTEHYKWQDKAKTETRVVGPKGNEFHEIGVTLVLYSLNKGHTGESYS